MDTPKLCEDLLAKVPPNLFLDIKYCLGSKTANKAIAEHIKKLLDTGGAKLVNYLSDSVTYLIADEADEDEISEATEIYEKPVITTEWVIQSTKCGIKLPIKGFSPLNGIFTKVRACVARIGKNDLKSLWAMITFHGGTVQRRLDRTCTHLICGDSSGRKYNKAQKSNSLNTSCPLKVVSPDWVIESIKSLKLVDEMMFHPRLLVPSTPVKSEADSPDKRIPKLSPTTQDVKPNIVGKTSQQATLRALLMPQSQNESTISSCQNASQINVPPGSIRVLVPQNHRLTQRPMRFISGQPPSSTSGIQRVPLHMQQVPTNQQPQFRQSQPNQPTQILISQSGNQPTQWIATQTGVGPSHMVSTAAQRESFSPGRPQLIVQQRPVYLMQQQNFRPQQYIQVGPNQRPMMLAQSNQIHSSDKVISNSQLQSRMTTPQQSPQPGQVSSGPRQTGQQLIQLQQRQSYTSLRELSTEEKNSAALLEGSHQMQSQQYLVQSNQHPMLISGTRMSQPGFSNVHGYNMPPQMMNEGSIRHRPPGSISHVQQYSPNSSMAQVRQAGQIRSQMMGSVQFPPGPPGSEGIVLGQQRIMMRPQQFYGDQVMPRAPGQWARMPQGMPWASLPSDKNIGIRYPPGTTMRTGQLVPRGMGMMPDGSHLQMGPNQPMQHRALGPSFIQGRFPDPSVRCQLPNSGPSPFDTDHQMTMPRLFGHEPRVEIPESKCLAGCIFFIVDYQDVDPEIYEHAPQKIKMFGGEVEDTYSDRVTHVLCDTQSNSFVLKAIKDGKRCVTSYWLIETLVSKKMNPPWYILHFPCAFSRKSNLPCREHIISTTNWSNEERIHLSRIVSRLGAKFTSHFSPSNTLLIAKDLKSARKISAAKEWKIGVVNIRWLIDIYFGLIEIISLPSQIPTKYLQFDIKDPFNVDFTTAAKFYHAWKVPIKVSPSQLEAHSPSHPSIDKGLANLRVNGFGSEKSPVASTSAQADEMDSLEPPTKKMKTNGPLTNGNGTESNSPLTSRESEMRPPRPENSHYKIMLTRIPKKQHDELVKLIEDLGCTLVSDARLVTHLVSTGVNRTLKFIQAMNYAKYIITPQWLVECDRQKRMISEDKFRVKDMESERIFAFSLREALERRNKREGPLFENLVIYVSPNTQPQPPVLKSLVEMCGGIVPVTPSLPTRRQLDKLIESGRKFIIVTCEADLYLYKDYDRSVPLVNVEFILLGILKQQVEYDMYRISWPCN